jgi:uncharacterized protein
LRADPAQALFAQNWPQMRGFARAKHTAESRLCDTAHTSRCNLRVAFFRRIPETDCNMSELTSIPALTIAIFLGGVVSGFSGFAFSAVAGVILLHLFEPLLAIPLMMCCSIASQISSLAAIRRHIQWRASVPLLIGGAGGIPIALYLLTLINAQVFRISIGIFLACYAVYMLTKPVCGIVRRAASPVVHSMVGFAGALVGGLTAMPGTLPIIWCDLRGVSKEHQRGEVQPFILAMQAFAVILLICRPGTLPRDFLPLLSLGIPAVVAGTLVGILLWGKIDDAKFRYSVLSLLLISGLVLIH